MAKLRGSQTLSIAAAENVTVKFIETNERAFDIVTLHSDINKSDHRESFGDFYLARDYYLQKIGALYCDGYR